MIGVYAQTQKSLFKFELDKISRDAVVKRAYLKLFSYAVSGRGGASSPKIEAFEIIRKWNPGTSPGNLYCKERVKKGETSWKCFSHPDGKWSSSGCSKAGEDYKVKVVGTAKPAPIKSWILVELDPSVVQRWIQNPASNNGIVLTSRGRKTIFRSSQFKDAAFRPRLILAFSKGVKTSK